MKTLLMFSIVSCALMARAGTLVPVYDNETSPTAMTLTVAAGITNSLDVAIPATVTTVVKDGLGTARLTVASTAKAAITVKQGTLAIGGDTYAGTPASITVESGSTLDLTGVTGKSYPFEDVPLTVGGHGAAGEQGAIVRRNSGYDAQAIFNKIELSADTTIVAEEVENARWGFGQTSSKSCTFDMNGHSLTCRGYLSWGNHRSAKALSITDPGDVIVATNGYMRWSSCDKLSSSPKPSASGKTLTLLNGSTLFLYMMRHDASADWKLVVPNGNSSTFRGEPHSNIYPQYYDGDLLIDGTLSCYVTCGTSNRDQLFPGTLSGAGTIRVCSDNYKAQNVRFTGSVLMNHRIGRINVAAGPLAFINSGTATVTNLGFTVGTLSGEGEVSIGGSGWDGSLARLVLDGNTSLGSGEDEGVTYAKSGNDKYLHQVSVGSGTAQESGRVGVLEVKNGAAITNGFVVGSSCGGSASANYGAIYLSGADSRIRWTTAQRTQLGDSGYGYIGIEDGIFEMPGSECTGQGGIFMAARLSGRGYIVQRGGSATFGSFTGNRSVWLTRPHGRGHSEYVMLGGTCTMAQPIHFFSSENSLGTGGDSAGLTVGGGSGTARMTVPCVLSWATTNKTGSTSWVNLNAGGTFECKFIYKEQNDFLTEGRDYSPNRFYLNFNGGTLKMSDRTNYERDFFYNVEKRAPTRVTVFKGGATIDTDCDVDWGVPILKPEGYGVKAVMLGASACETNKFIGPLRVKAISGNGVAFTAITDFDNDGRTNRGVIVTCPGFGFSGDEDTATFVRAEGRGYNYNSTLNNGTDGYACTTTLEALDATGGFTKKGTGTLTLSSSNTWGGVTRIEAGTLAFTHEEGYPGGDLEIPAAAIVSASGPLLAAHAFALASGKKIRITGADALDDKTFGAARTLATFTTPVADSVADSLALVNGDGETISSKIWHLRLANGNTALKFGKNSGTVIVLR